MTYIIHRLIITAACALFLSMLGSLFFALAHVIDCVLTRQLSAPDWNLMLATAIVWAGAGVVLARGVHYD